MQINLSFMFLFLVIVILKCLCTISEEPPELSNDSGSVSEVIKNIENIEKLSKAGEKLRSGTPIPIENAENIYDGIIQIIQTTVESFKDKKFADEFLEAKGIDRIIAPNIMVPHGELKTNVLILTKILFEVTPTATKAFIPVHIVDRLLDIFENDDNLARKAHSLDILSKWLPENPVVQARVMKVKGLEPFYNQISKLDSSVTKTLLELFGTIVNEHTRVRNGKIEKFKSDKVKLYQRIGLIERMSTPTVCNGLLNIVQVIWNNDIKNDMLIILLELTKNMNEYCLNVLKGKSKAIGIFELIFKFVMNPKNEDLLKSALNITALRDVVGGYLEELKVRDEL